MVPKNGAARAALSGALHDLVGKRLGVPLYKLWGLDARKAPPSSFTIGIDTPEKTRAKVKEAAGYSILKIKLGTDRDEEILKTIRDATDKPLRVDANAGWTRARALQMLPALKEFGVEFVEQPLPGRPGGHRRRTQGQHPGRWSWDESCIAAADIPRVAQGGRWDQYQTGEMRIAAEALRMIATARAHKMLVMVGCMIETSIGITAAAHFTPLVDAADLDGAALTANDPYAGAEIGGGPIKIPGRSRTGRPAAVTRLPTAGPVRPRSCSPPGRHPLHLRRPRMPWLPGSLQGSGSSYRCGTARRWAWSSPSTCRHPRPPRSPSRLSPTRSPRFSPR